MGLKVLGSTLVFPGLGIGTIMAGKFVIIVGESCFRA